jgi:hypothetical protein
MLSWEGEVLTMSVYFCLYECLFVACIAANSVPPSPQGRIEIRLFLILYFLSLLFQLFTTGSFIQQGTMVLVILTSIHAALGAALFWGLLANGLVATQIVEDGTLSSLIVGPLLCFCL